MKPPKLTTESEGMAAWWRQPGILYFFAAGRPARAIKIGVSSVTVGKSLVQCVRQRFGSIQSSNHETIELLGIVRFIEGEYPTRSAEVRERELHIKYAHLQRFKRHTRGAEWFSVSPELLAEIEAISESPDSLGLPRVIAEATNRFEYPA
jgi:hypothetical protein